ncbi:hypothetical protein SAMN05216466_106114 [Paraburkholderia phenazinium]|uniref:Uncharacterized protein n=1 Tax=Paraburkholderia phenazinium TaxID=60549 RepID=A0A1G7YBF9_9BURK|nr:hypothetical protein [Paraburkholderia phenazinium]SDG93705.1 hypothetical protein SAMN05216466_106114 [Paraburkholderia phenazinium]
MDWTFRMYLDAGLLLVGWALFINLLFLRFAHPVAKVAGPIARVVALVSTGFALFSPPVPGSWSAVMITVVAVWWGLYAGGVAYRFFTFHNIVMGQPPKALEAMQARLAIEQEMIELGRSDLIDEDGLSIGKLTPDEMKRCKRAAIASIRAMRAEWAERFKEKARART